MSALKQFVLCLGIVAAVLKSSSAISDQDAAKIRDLVLPAMSECGKEFNTAMDAITEARQKGDPGTINSCFFACVFKKTGFMTADGKFDKNEAIEKVKKVLTGDDLKLAEEVANDCVKVNDEPVGDGEKGCDRAQHLFKCLASHKDKFGGL